MADMSVKRINVIEIDDKKSRDTTESIMWNILEESRPCIFRKTEEKTRYCDALNRIMYKGVDKNKSVVKPEKCAECQFSDNKRGKPIEKA